MNILFSILLGIQALLFFTLNESIAGAICLVGMFLVCAITDLKNHEPQ